MLNESDIENLIDNASDTDILLIKKFFQLGMNIGQSITDQIEDGTLQLPINGKLVVILPGDIYQNQNKLGILDSFVSYIPQILTIGNAGLVIIGGHTLVQSSINYLEARNKGAKICYGLSVLCSGTGAATSSVAIFCERYGLSTTGILGDSLGHVLLKAGDKVNQLGKRIEGKPKSFFKFRGGQIPRRRPVYSSSGTIAFVPTGCSSTISLQEIVSNLPYERIFFVRGTLLAIYSYGKLLVSAYSFLESKFYPKERYLQQVKYNAKFLIDSLDYNRIYRIYYVALVPSVNTTYKFAVS